MGHAGTVCTGLCPVRADAIALSDLGGGMLAHATPYGTQFFCFRIHFHQKAPTSEVHAPPNGCTPPLWEILDLPLNCNTNYNCGMWYIATMMSYCSIMQDVALKEFQSLENCPGKLTFGCKSLKWLVRPYRPRLKHPTQSQMASSDL